MYARFTLRVVLAFWLAASCAIAAPAREVRITVYEVAEVPGPVGAMAKNAIRNIFEEAGFQLKWTDATPTRYERRMLSNPVKFVSYKDDACSPGEVFSVTLQLTDRFSAEYRPGALGFALPFAKGGVRVTMFYDRIETVARNTGVPLDRVLTAMVAHELAHVLMGTDSHFQHGLMRSQWLRQDLKALMEGVPQFAAAEIQLMHRNHELWRTSHHNCLVRHVAEVNRVGH